MKDKIFEYLKNKKVLILGFGKEGKSTYNFIRSMDKYMDIGIADINAITDEVVNSDSRVAFYIGENYLSSCLDYDVIIKGPGVVIKDMLDIETKNKITCQADLFLKYAPSFNIGITGTKGKSTTSSLIYHLLKNLRDNVVFMGNIGIPFFDCFSDVNNDTICVMELGVHQLEYVKSSPNISVILNLYQEHLDHYTSLENYFDSKKNIYKFQKEKDVVILPESDYIKLDKEDIKSRVITTYKRDKDYFVLEDDTLEISVNDNITINLSDIKTSLLGRHNLYNISICLTIIKLLDFDLNKALEYVSTFKGLEHRLEYVGKYNNIKFYNDSIATSAESTIRAIETLKEIDTIIIGGMDREIDYSGLILALIESNISNIVLLPDTGYRIYDMLIKENCNKNLIKVSNMEEAVSVSKEITKEDGICLMSPAAASYGFYKNFEERGKHFKELVKD